MESVQFKSRRRKKKKEAMHVTNKKKRRKEGIMLTIWLDIYKLKKIKWLTQKVFIHIFEKQNKSVQSQ